MEEEGREHIDEFEVKIHKFFKTLDDVCQPQPIYGEITQDLIGEPAATVLSGGGVEEKPITLSPGASTSGTSGEPVSGAAVVAPVVETGAAVSGEAPVVAVAPAVSGAAPVVEPVVAAPVIPNNPYKGVLLALETVYNMFKVNSESDEPITNEVLVQSVKHYIYQFGTVQLILNTLMNQLSPSLKTYRDEQIKIQMANSFTTLEFLKWYASKPATDATQPKPDLWKLIKDFFTLMETNKAKINGFNNDKKIDELVALLPNLEVGDTVKELIAFTDLKNSLNTDTSQNYQTKLKENFNITDATTNVIKVSINELFKFLKQNGKEVLKTKENRDTFITILSYIVLDTKDTKVYSVYQKLISLTDDPVEPFTSELTTTLKVSALIKAFKDFKDRGTAPGAAVLGEGANAAVSDVATGASPSSGESGATRASGLQQSPDVSGLTNSAVKFTEETTKGLLQILKELNPARYHMLKEILESPQGYQQFSELMDDFAMKNIQTELSYKHIVDALTQLRAQYSGTDVGEKEFTSAVSQLLQNLGFKLEAIPKVGGGGFINPLLGNTGEEPKTAPSKLLTHTAELKESLGYPEDDIEHGARSAIGEESDGLGAETQTILNGIGEKLETMTVNDDSVLASDNSSIKLNDLLESAKKSIASPNDSTDYFNHALQLITIPENTNTTINVFIMLMDYLKQLLNLIQVSPFNELLIQCYEAVILACILKYKYLMDSSKEYGDEIENVKTKILEIRFKILRRTDNIHLENQIVNEAREIIEQFDKDESRPATPAPPILPAQPAKPTLPIALPEPAIPAPAPPVAPAPNPVDIIKNAINTGITVGTDFNAIHDAYKKIFPMDGITDDLKTEAKKALLEKLKDPQIYNQYLASLGIADDTLKQSLQILKDDLLAGLEKKDPPDANLLPKDKNTLIAFLKELIDKVSYLPESSKTELKGKNNLGEILPGLRKYKEIANKVRVVLNYRTEFGGGGEDSTSGVLAPTPSTTNLPGSADKAALLAAKAAKAETNKTTIFGGEQDTVSSIPFVSIPNLLDANGQKKGPFYRVLNSDTFAQYQSVVSEDLEQLKGKDINHLIYTGYGYSGSGKTYSLFGANNSQNNVLSFITSTLNTTTGSISDIRLKIIDYYEEEPDNECIPTTTIPTALNIISPKIQRGEYTKEKIQFNEVNTIITKFQSLRKRDWNMKERTIKITDNQLNNPATFGGAPLKELTKLPDKPTTYHIRETPNNPESSRSHLFIDLKFKINGTDKRITLVDMAGSENVKTIQEDYFIRLNEYNTKPFEDTLNNYVNEIIKNIDSMQRQTINGQIQLNGLGPIIERLGGAEKGVDFNKASPTQKNTFKNIIKTEEWLKLMNVESATYKKYIKQNIQYYNLLKYISIIKPLISLRYVLGKAFLTDSRVINKDKDIATLNKQINIENITTINLDFTNLNKLFESLGIAPLQFNKGINQYTFEEIKDYLLKRVSIIQSGISVNTQITKTIQALNDNIQNINNKLISIINAIQTNGYVSNYLEPYFKTLSKNDKSFIFALSDNSISHKITGQSSQSGATINYFINFNNIFSKYNNQDFKDYLQNHVYYCVRGDNIVSLNNTDFKQVEPGDKFYGDTNTNKNIATAKSTIIVTDLSKNTEASFNFIEHRSNLLDTYLIGNIHCPLRFQGNYIQKSINSMGSFIELLLDNNNTTKNIDLYFPGSVLYSSTDTKEGKRLTLFVNSRLDFTPTKTDAQQYNEDAKYRDAYTMAMDYAVRMNPLIQKTPTPAGVPGESGGGSVPYRLQWGGEEPKKDAAAPAAKAAAAAPGAAGTQGNIDQAKQKFKDLTDIKREIIAFETTLESLLNKVSVFESSKASVMDENGSKKTDSSQDAIVGAYTYFKEDGPKLKKEFEDTVKEMKTNVKKLQDRIQKLLETENQTPVILNYLSQLTRIFEEMIDTSAGIPNKGLINALESYYQQFSGDYEKAYSYAKQMAEPILKEKEQQAKLAVANPLGQQQQMALKNQQDAIQSYYAQISIIKTAIDKIESDNKGIIDAVELTQIMEKPKKLFNEVEDIIKQTKLPNEATNPTLLEARAKSLIEKEREAKTLKDEIEAAIKSAVDKAAAAGSQGESYSKRRQTLYGGVGEATGTQIETAPVAESKDKLTQTNAVIKEGLNTIRGKIVEPLLSIYKRQSTPGFALNTGDQLFTKILNEYMNTRTEENENDVRNRFMQQLEANHLIPRQVLAITTMDRIIFILITLFIRTISTAVIVYLIERGTVSAMVWAITGYLILYTLILIAFVMLVNLDMYRMRIIFNYVNFHANSGKIYMHLGLLFIIGILIYLIISNINFPVRQVAPKAISDNQKTRLIMRFQILTGILWAILALIVGLENV